ncbi:MAG TPA: hypothetical protein VF103_07975, partial [Polyangiaceae bacterium]
RAIFATQSESLGDVIVSGVSVQQQPSCYTTDADVNGDDLVGYRGLMRVSQVNPGKFELVMHRSQTTASATQNIATQSRELPTPASQSRVASWASIVE